MRGIGVAQGILGLRTPASGSSRHIFGLRNRLIRTHHAPLVRFALSE